MKLTKQCFLPWTFMQIHAGGMMQCCAVGPDTDTGDFLLDYSEKKARGEQCDPFNNEGLRAIREGILTGNLRPMCRDCFFAHNVWVTTEEFEKKLKEFLHERKPELDLEHSDLREVYAYTWMAISFTNRCNLSCVYCVQSVHKDTNPYFKMDFPYEYAEETLELLASQGVIRFSTCVEGEATLYKHWYELFSKFHERHPEIKLRMTTNLNRKFSDEEIELLCKYRILDISMDTVDPELYSRLRVNGRLELVLENLDKIEQKTRELGIKGPIITLHPVVSDLTWRGLEALADFAFDRGYGLSMGNYEERVNTVAYREKLLKPLAMISEEEQLEARDMIKRIKEKAKRLDIICSIQGELFKRIDGQVEKDYNYFKPYDDNPVFRQFFEQYPKGSAEANLNIIYDVDNISHEGILMLPGSKIVLKNMEKVESVVLREIHIYKKGTVSSRYGQTVMLRYRKKVMPENGTICLEPNFVNENIEKILMEVCDYNWAEDEEKQ